MGALNHRILRIGRPPIISRSAREPMCLDVAKSQIHRLVEYWASFHPRAAQYHSYQNEPSLRNGQAG
jgi:hypothetical protein